MKSFDFITNTLFVLMLGFYLISVLQWFSYKLSRIVFHFTKPLWHFAFFIVPLILYYALNAINGLFFAIYFYCILLAMMIFWHLKLDKKLVFTWRVKIFFLILIVSNLSLNLAFLKCEISPFAVILPLAISLIISALIEKIKSVKFKQKAFEKLNLMPDLLIIEITASFGKTSIKNFLYEILSAKFITQKTPRSVNTLMGIIKDINENLRLNTQIYIAEAGARESGDIDEITRFLRPQIVIVGQIGQMHIEYFKSIENILKTKLEALNSVRLTQAFLHSTTLRENSDKIVIYDKFVKNIDANLNGLKFELEIDGKIEQFKANLLGAFNAQNIAVCVFVAKFLGINLDEIGRKISNLQSVQHRLQRIESSEKFIIDDGFNGNFDGMVASFELVKSYNGVKILVTPGIIESNAAQNENLAKKADEIFDKIIVTGEQNRQIFANFIDANKLIICTDKSKLVQILAANTHRGDLILFSNDAPNFI